MKPSPRQILGLAVAPTVILAATAVAATIPDGVNNPTPGEYQGNAKGAFVTNGHSEGEGWFRLKKTDSGYAIVPSRTVGAIVSPSDPRDRSPKACNQYNATLPTKRIPVRSGGFRWEGDAPIGYSQTPPAPKVHVIFKGKWVTRTKVTGTTRFKRGACDDTREWTMKTPPAPY